MSEDRVTHGALVDHPVQVERTVQTPCPTRTQLPPARPSSSSSRVSLGLLREEAGMLGIEVRVGAGCRLEGHGADGALVENLAVRRLDVRLDGVHTPKHNCTAGAPLGRTCGTRW